MKFLCLIIAVVCLAVVDAQLVYPAVKRGGDVCVCKGSLTLPGSTCTPALLRNQPYRPTPLTSHFIDVDPGLGSIGDATITTVLAGTAINPIVLEIVSRDDQLVAEQVGAASVEFSSQVKGVPVMTSLQGSSAIISSITIASIDVGTSGVSIVSSAIGNPTTLQDGMFLISDLRIYASGLATGAAVRVCLNVSVTIEASLVGQTTTAGVLWILMGAIEIRNSALVGNSSNLFYPTFLHFPVMYSPILEVGWPTAQSIYGVAEIVMDVPMGDVTIYVRDVTEQITNSLDGQMMEVEGYYTSSGAEVEGLIGTRMISIQDGKAKFTGLGFDSTTTSRSGIELHFSVPLSTSTQPVRSSVLVAVNVPEFLYRLDFSAKSFFQFNLDSYDNIIQTLGSPVAPAFKAVLGVPLPVIEIQVMDSANNIDTNTEYGLFIVAKCVGAELEPWSSVAPVQKGEARFAGLTFSGFPIGVMDTSRKVVVTFQLSTSADPTETISSARLVLYSPIIEVFQATSARTPSQMRYSSDRVNAAIPVQPEGFILLTAGTQISQSIRVDVLAQDGWPVSTAGVEVGIELEGGDKVGGALTGTLRVPAGGGIAEFNDLAVIATTGNVWKCFASNATSCPAVALKATLYNSGTTVQPLLSSIVYLVHKSTSTGSTSTAVDTDDTATRDRLGVRSKVSMRFEPSGSSLFTNEDQDSFATVRIIVPPITIEVLDSTGAVDVSANSLTIVASAGNIPLNGAVATTLRGRATFSSLLFADSGAAVLTFTCQATRSGDPVEGTTLTTGSIVVEASVAPTFGLKFHRESSVQGEAQTVFGALGYPLPIIGVIVVDSAHVVSGDNASVIDITASIPGGTFDPSSTITVPVVEGSAWFTNLIVSSVVSGAGSRAITFSAHVNSARAQTLTITSGANSVVVKDFMAYVHTKTIATGPVVFVDPSEITEIQLVPYQPSSTPIQGNPVAAAPVNSTVTANIPNGTQFPVMGTRVNTLINSRRGGNLYQSTFPASVGFGGGDIATAFATVAQAPKGSVVEMALWMRNAASRLTLPADASLQNVTIAASGVSLTLGSSSGIFPLDPRPSGAVVAPIRLTFSDLSFVAERYVVGQYATITFTSPDAKVGSVMHERPLLVSPVAVEGSAPDSVPDMKVILVEVLDGGPSFDADVWAGNLALSMNVPKRRIELLKVRQGASATADFDRSWSGTRILLQFLPPTPQDVEKLSSNQLAQLLLSLSPASCGSVAPLKIRRKLLLSDDTECDLHVLDEQRRAAQRCVATSSPGDRCTCHLPMFNALGPRCKKTSQMLAVCATLRQCGRHPAISDPCFELTYLIYLQYALIGVYALLFLLVLYAVYLWKSGYFSKRNRRKLGDGIRGETTASLKMVTGEEDPNSMMI